MRVGRDGMGESVSGSEYERGREEGREGRRETIVGGERGREALLCSHHKNHST